MHSRDGCGRVVSVVSALEYLQSLAFPADRFQTEAAAAIDRGETVVVSAPTGSGKTVVAEAAIARARERGERVLYTSPLKALSNQKYGDLCAQHGAAAVGLLTGDNSINGRAPVVVMTTEVLRNMMYAGSPDLAGVATVVLDEVHYLQDRARGAVWEEIIIHLDRDIRLVCLSATVPNAEEFAAWIEARRGPTTLVMETERPVPLSSEYLMRDRWEGGRLRLLPLFSNGDRRHPNPRLAAMLRRSGGTEHRYAGPRRTETCEFLRREGLLPAIYFIFSRAGCTAAAAQVVDRGLRLTTAAEAAEIRRIAAARTAHLPEEDLAVLGYGRWLAGLEAGVASHHAGLIPAFKETAEELFTKGLVRLVFATETLSLGINMPARAVVLESLYKFGGEQHELLLPGDYTQLTGRAGRRGIDRQGTAVVLHSPYLPFERVAAVAAAGGHPMRSSFRPTYNMAANLMAVYSREEAERLLNASFAQYRHDRLADQLARLIEEEEERLAADRVRARCELGDVSALLDQAPAHQQAMGAFAATLLAGDVLAWPAEGGGQVRSVVIARGHGATGRGRGPRPRLLMVGEEGGLHRLSPEQLPSATAVLGRLDLPEPFRPREAAYREEVARRLHRWGPARDAPRTAYQPVGPTPTGATGCPDLAAHLAAARSARRRESRLAVLRGRVGAGRAGMIPRLRAIAGLLQGWGYAEGWRLTPAGQRLRFIYNDLDLLLAESLGRGLFEDLSPAETAALASLFTFEPRDDSPPPTWATQGLRERAERVAELWGRLTEAEEAAGLATTRGPEVGFAAIAYRWCRGAGLQDLFGEEGSEVGGFVRNCRTLIDLLRQLSDAAPHLRPVIQQALRAVDRGVVAASGAV
jgi:ATP-dependent RNA helicase HelY